MCALPIRIRKISTGHVLLRLPPLMAPTPAAAAAAMPLHHLLRPPSSSLCYPKPFLQRKLPAFFSRSPRVFCSPSASLTHLQIPSPLHYHLSVPHSEDESEKSEDFDYQQEEESAVIRSEIPITAAATTSSSSSLKVPKLSVKEKKELAAYAHGLGKKLKVQQVGKAGVTSSLANSFIETLEANEILKLKVHNSCPGELTDVVRQLEEATGSVAVGQIGRSIILYRPSLTKMEAAEKKKQQMQRIRKRFHPKPTEVRKKPVRSLSNRGRNASSRFQT